MKRLAVVTLAVVTLAGCSLTKTRVIEQDGDRFFCTYKDHVIGPDNDTRCVQILDGVRP